MNKVILAVILGCGVGTFACGEKNPKSEDPAVTSPVSAALPGEDPAEGAAQSGAVEEEARDEAAFEVASFEVPDLDSRLAARLAGAIAAVEGVRRAIPRIENGRLDVEFAPPKASPAMLLEKMKGVAPAVALSGVRPGDPKSPAEHGCGGCPMRNTCGGF